MNSKVIGIVVAVLVVIGVVWFVARGQGSKPSPVQSASPASSVSPAGSASPQVNGAAAVTIAYSSSGFSPADTTVKSGDAVTFVNNASTEVQVDSNPHPIHTDDTDLNVGAIAPGQSKTVTLTKKGSFGFHNHLNPSDKGNITIQ